MAKHPHCIDRGSECISVGFVKHYIARLDRRSGRATLSEFTGGLVDAINEGDAGKSRTGWGRWLGDLGFAPSSEVSSIEHDTKQVRRNEGKLSCS